MRPAATTGEDGPRPGNSTFQRRFSLALQVVGRSFSSATPLAGPRNWGQSPARARPSAKSNAPPRAAREVRRFMGELRYLLVILGLGGHHLERHRGAGWVAQPHLERPRVRRQHLVVVLAHLQ